MDEEIERLVIGVRADTAGFARDVAAMRGELDGPLVAGADRAGRAIESALLRAARSGKFGFEDLKSTILSLMNAIAAAAVQGAFGGQGGGYGGGGGGGSGAGGDLGLLYTFISGLLGGSPGRATGGPVSPGRPYWVGERGPELFVPTASGRVEAGGGGSRDVRVAITVNAMAGAAPQALQRSGRQVARAVRAALEAS